MSNIFQRILLACIFIPSVYAAAQTGQALIANPLLSPDRLKEVKRQIVEAAHKDLLPPPAPMPALPIPPVSQAPLSQFGPAMTAGMAQGTTPAENARKALSRVQVMAVVGDAAILSVQTAAPVARLDQMQSFPFQQTPMQGLQSPVNGQQALQPVKEDKAARRASSVTVRQGEPAFIEGVEVNASVRGDSVRLTLAEAPQVTVFQGTVQPAMYSPSTSVAASDQEKPNSDFINGRKLDSVSTSGAASQAPAAQQQAQQSAQYSNQTPRTTTP